MVKDERFWFGKW